MVRLWDVEHAALLKSQTGPADEVFNTVQFSPDARWIVTTSAVTTSTASQQRTSGQTQTAAVKRRYAVRVRRAADLTEVAGQTGMPVMLANINGGRDIGGIQHAATI